MSEGAYGNIHNKHLVVADIEHVKKMQQFLEANEHHDAAARTSVILSSLETILTLEELLEKHNNKIKQYQDDLCGIWRAVIVGEDNDRSTKEVNAAVKEWRRKRLSKK